ncbi:MAG: adenine phosphoribosyltransferase [Novosphingobium sp.]|jgi:adenine phosphoribosyltransferase|nr:adenine phosphoribosyltransferase [Novosphingobium sp.]
MTASPTAAGPAIDLAVDLKALIRSVPDFPRPGILFRDVTTLIGHGAGFAAAVELLAEQADAAGAQAIAGIEARGFIFGAAAAARLGIGFVPVRKPGKLPVPVLALDYALEYGTGTLEIDPDAFPPGQRIAVIDDLLATGGTALAATQLLRKASAEVTQALFVIDLPDLGGSHRLREAGLTVSALMDFPGH